MIISIVITGMGWRDADCQQNAYATHNDFPHSSRPSDTTALRLQLLTDCKLCEFSLEAGRLPWEEVLNLAGAYVTTPITSGLGVLAKVEICGGRS